LLGRQVKLIYRRSEHAFDVPGIYTKLLDVDKVDLVVSGYATNMSRPRCRSSCRKTRPSSACSRSM